MLSEYDGKDGRLVRLQTSGMVPVGVADNGALLVAAAVDYVYWDAAAADFAKRGDFGARRRVLLVAGNATQTARRALADSGWSLRTGLRAYRDAAAR
jgi:hypothetical protein